MDGDVDALSCARRLCICARLTTRSLQNSGKLQSIWKQKLGENDDSHALQIRMRLFVDRLRR